jgi:hypothetical protein
MVFCRMGCCLKESRSCDSPRHPKWTTILGRDLASLERSHVVNIASWSGKGGKIGVLLNRKKDRCEYIRTMVLESRLDGAEGVATDAALG